MAVVARHGWTSGTMKDWNDRLNTPGINGIKPSPRTFSYVVEGQPMLVPTARQVDDFIRSIPEGVEMDVRALRTALALEHGAEVTCPITIGWPRWRSRPKAGWCNWRTWLNLPKPA